MTEFILISSVIFLFSDYNNFDFTFIIMNNKTIKFLGGDRQLYDKFKLRQVIGTGNSIVYEAVDDEGNIECIKEVRLDDKQAEFIFRKQIQLLSKIKKSPHPHIVQYRGSYILQQQKGNISSLKKGYIQMQKGIANLKTYLGQRKQIFDDMIQVFAHLQKSQVAHRDVKPSNILLFNEDPIYFKVCDVGAGTAVGFCDHTKQMTVIGTPYYLSPELYKAYKQRMVLVNYKAFKSDCYSLGLVFLQCCLLKKLDERLTNEKQKIQKMIEQIKTIYPNIIGLGKILRKMLDPQISNRLDFIELQKYISENNFLRNKIDKNITLDPLIFQKISSSNQIIINKIENLSQMQTLVSTESKFEKLNIDLSSTEIGQAKQLNLQFLQNLINIKYMKLAELRITMEMCNISDKQILLISQSLEKNKNMKVLSLSFWNNRISQIGLKAILKTIQNNLLQLKLLNMNISSNQIKIDKNFQNFFDFTNLNKLETFQINLGFNQIQSDFLSSIFKQISNASKIKSLTMNLQSTKINAYHLNKAIKQLYSLQNIEQLSINVSCNTIRQEGIYALSDLCTVLLNMRSCKIILRNSQISDKGCIQFLKSIGKLQNLRQLKLNLMNNQITQKAFKNGMPFVQNNLKLQILDLNISNNKLTDFAFKYLCNSLITIKKIHQIRLVFDNCMLTEKGCLYIGRLLSQQPTLEEIDLSLRYNDVKFDGIQYVCAGLIQIKKIKRLKLNLQGTLIGDYSANYLASCLLRLRNLNLVDLNLQNCNLTSQTMSDIVRVVRQCCQKTQQITINMRRNRQIKEQLIQQLRTSMQNRKVAIKIDTLTEGNFITV